ncbi:energy transducer TonB [Acinetobacter shaoyimingii]|uniref:Protein TonB n=1 Tax=Acinetobacter shaoyimingii TaxID=2715164 RepID=A0A6G8RSS1_9GAMM|nr:energy transducer TonB [Acinetobacter shaoyimingii]NHB56540.1 TonB family protein [Acinetobacter shaoyimingii]QIO04954.1 TonB family protein [Acinetobacter shaoyimingii]
MSQSSTATMQTPNPMKKKVIIALVSVLVGHMGVLFAISHMKVSELKKIDKEPLKVRFVQIKEDAPPPPPPPSEPVKPKVQPKPEPKVVEPPPVVKPKIIAEKPKPNIEKPKPVVEQQDNRIEQQRLEQQRQQERLAQQQREQQLREQQQREAERQRQAAEQAERDRLAREQASKPRSLSAGQISWARSPRPSYTNSDLKGSDRSIVVSIEADTNGSITNVRVVRSTGIDALDQKIVRAVRGAKFRPYKENGVAYPFKAEQPFELKLNSNG